MENNYDDIIESISSNSAVWISGAYETSKSQILNLLEEFFIDKNFELRSFYVEGNETLVSFFNKITNPIININSPDQDLEFQLSQLLEIISENQKNGLVIIIDELENWFIRIDNNQLDSIGRFIQLLAEFVIRYKNVFLMIASSEIPIGRNFNYINRIKDKFHNIWLG